MENHGRAPGSLSNVHTHQGKYGKYVTQAPLGTQLYFAVASLAPHNDDKFRLRPEFQFSRYWSSAIAGKQQGKEDQARALWEPGDGLAVRAFCWEAKGTRFESPGRMRARCTRGRSCAVGHPVCQFPLSLPFSSLSLSVSLSHLKK